MRSIKIVLGLGFVVALMMSLSVSSASATWDLCANVGASKGKFETNACVKEGGKKEWEWQGVTGKDLVNLLNVAGEKLKLEDMTEKTRIECTGSGEGTVGPGNEDLINTIKANACSFVAGKAGPCEENKPITMNFVHLPWRTELKLITGRSGTWDLIGSDGAGEPGWNVECTVAGIFKVSDVCEGEAQAKVENKMASGTVEAKFEGELSGKANCTAAGKANKGAGLVEGGTIIESVSGNSLKFLAP